MKDELEDRSEKMENEIKDMILKHKKESAKDIIYDFGKEDFEEEAFDNRYIITEQNKVDFIKYIEQWVRGSFEYTFMIDILKTVLDVKSCAFFKGYSLDNKMKLQFHHHPFTLFDYTEAVVNKQLDNCEADEPYVLENEVAVEVALLHYRLAVGLVPLDPTSHQQVHDGFLDIHPDLVIGEYEKFFKEYEKYIPEPTKQKYTEWLTKNTGSEVEYPENFKYKPTIINAYNKFAITTDKVDKLLLQDKLDKVNNEDINKLLLEENKK